MLLKLAALALLPAATLATEPNSATDCQLAYVQSYGVVHKCEALVTFSKCLSAFPENSLMESMLMKDNAKDCEEYWNKESSPEIKVRRNDFQLTVDDAKDIKFYRHRREELSIFDMNQQIVDLQQTVANLTAQLKSVSANVVNNVETKLDAMKKEQDDTKKEIEDAMDDLSDSVNQKVSKATNELTTQVNNVKTLVSDSVSNLTSSTNKALTTQSTSILADVDTKIKSMNTSVNAVAVVAQAAKAGNVDKPIHMWSGGPKSHDRNSGWRDFVMDRVEYDTAAPYFQKVSNTRFKALKSGMYKITYEANQHVNSRCWRHMQFMVDGVGINYQHKYVYSWMSMRYTVEWHIKAGQSFWGRFYTAGCGNSYTFHGDSSWRGAQSRVQVEYVGQLEGKCTSNQGLC